MFRLFILVFSVTSNHTAKSELLLLSLLSVNTATLLGVERLRDVFDYRQGQKVVHSSAAYKRALQPTQRPVIQWVTEILFHGVKRPESETDRPPLNAED
jgi:hypothetical protein